MPKKMGIRKEKQMKADFLRVLEQNMGVVAPSLKTLGLSKWYYDKWMASDAEFKTAVENINKIALDFVESKLYKLINEGNVPSTIFYLKCKGKDRGYIEKNYLEQEIKLDPLKIEIKEKKKDE